MDWADLGGLDAYRSSNPGLPARSGIDAAVIALAQLLDQCPARTAH
jgi:hypothetical protein